MLLYSKKLTWSERLFSQITPLNVPFHSFTMSDYNLSTPPKDFSHWVSDALNQLYDSVTLQSHPLGKALFPGESNPLRRCQLLRKTLLDAIHSLEPGPGVPGSAPDRRFYRLVELRYIEGLDPYEAMTRMSLAKSQFYRDQARATDMLAEILWPLMPAGATGPVEVIGPTGATRPTGAVNQEAGDPRSQLIHAEVERLSPGSENEGIEAEALADDLRRMISPLAEDKKVQIGEFNLDALNGKALDRILLRQTLLTALLAALDLDGLRRLDMRSTQTDSSRTVRVSAEVENRVETPLSGLNEQLEACRLLVEALNGELQTGVTPQQVSFNLTWPDSQRHLLLVIDDNAGMADLFRLYLKGGTWQVLGASGGREAREILHENRPDLILLDILMPQEDGWELLRALKTDEASKNIPVMICSVLKQPQIALKMGAAAYVEKPVSQQALLTAVAQIG
jgi:CheY-like chemotaxis protein